MGKSLDFPCFILVADILTLHAVKDLKAKPLSDTDLLKGFLGSYLILQPKLDGIIIFTMCIIIVLKGSVKYKRLLKNC